MDAGGLSIAISPQPLDLGPTAAEARSQAAASKRRVLAAQVPKRAVSTRKMAWPDPD
jgi:hypothetical protein